MWNKLNCGMISQTIAEIFAYPVLNIRWVNARMTISSIDSSGQI
jgi:hypothetical protein